MTERIELRFVGGYDEDEFLQSTAYWVSDSNTLRTKVREALTSLMNMMRFLKDDVFCIGQVFEYEGHRVHLVFERSPPL